MSGWLQIARWQDVADVVVVAILGFVAIRYVRRARLSPSLLGLLILGVLYGAATWLGLTLVASLFQGFFAALVIVLVVVFQDDLRRLFEQIGSWRPGRTAASEPLDSVSMLVRIVRALAERRFGALIILPGREPIDRHVDGGIELGGRLSEPLLLSIFDAGSPGHDGAVVIRGNTVERFAAHLPLSSNREMLPGSGTRHAAALGLAERCDARCIVVSEERGTISLARNGAIERVEAGDLPGLLATEDAEAALPPRRRKRTAWIDALAASLGALLAWFVFVPGSDVADISVPAEVSVTNLPSDLVLDSIDPPRVSVSLRGLRRELLLLDRERVSIEIDGYLARLGRRTFTITAQDVHKPEGLSVVALADQRVRLSLHAADADIEERDNP